MKFAILNHSSDPAITPEILSTIADALNAQLRDVCAEWGGDASVRAASSADDVRADEVPACIFDDADAPGVLGYHDRDPQGRAYVRVFWAPIKAAGGTLTTGAVSLSCTLSHELCETVGDPSANFWCDRGDGTEEALELCLAGETEVVLTRGERATIESLAKRGGFFDVLTTHGLACAGHARLTAHAADTVRVIFTDGSSVRCTPTHRFMLDDGDFRRADFLMPSTRLRSVVQMFPSVSVTGALYRADRDAEPSRCVLGSLVGASQFDDDRIGEHRLAVGFTESASVARHQSLRGSIEHVLSVSAEKQMVGPNARLHVALVADAEARSNLSEVDLVGQPMGEDTSLSNGELTVAGARSRARPEPASLRLAHAGPESLCQRGRACVVGDESLGHVTVFPQSIPVSGAEPSRFDRATAVHHETKTHCKIVHSVEGAGKADVFDLTVPGARNFAIGAGVFAHNCDRVEDQSYAIAAVAVSDFLLRAAFDPGAPPPFDRMGALQHATDVVPGGYVILRQAGADLPSQARGCIAEHKRASKAAPGSRSHRRGVRLSSVP